MNLIIFILPFCATSLEGPTGVLGVLGVLGPWLVGAGAATGATVGVCTIIAAKMC
jgi:hypothetical protein